MSAKLSTTAIFLTFLFICKALAARESVPGELGEQFKKELSDKTLSLTDMYETLKGSVKVRLTVDKGGWISLVETKENRLDDSEPLAAILEQIYAWRFTPLPIEQRNVSFDYVVPFDQQFDSTRMFFVVMAIIMVTITGLIVLVRIG